MSYTTFHDQEHTTGPTKTKYYKSPSYIVLAILSALLSFTSCLALVTTAILVYKFRRNLPDPTLIHVPSPGKPLCNEYPNTADPSDTPACLCNDDPFSPLPSCNVWLKADTQDGDTAVILLAGVLGFAVAVGGSWEWGRIWRCGFDDRIKRHRYIRLAFFYTVPFLATLAILIYTFAHEAKQPAFDIYEGFRNAYFERTLTREKWVCELNNVRADDGSLNWTGKACFQARMARWCLVPIVALGGLLVCLAFWGCWRSKMLERRRLGTVEVVA